MLPLNDEDLIIVYLHKPTKKIIGLTPTLNKNLLKIQLEPSILPKWGNIALWSKTEQNIFDIQCSKGEIEILKFPTSSSNFNFLGPLL